jgi:tetratricopeptide (TPR) repeat protein
MRMVTAVLFSLAAGAVSAGQPDRSHQEAMRHLRLGQENLRAERWDKAESEFRAAVHIDPLLELAHYGLGQVFMATKRFPAAVAAFTDCRNAFTQLASRDATHRLENEKRLMDQIQQLQDQKLLLQTGRFKATDLGAQVQKVDMMIHELQGRRYQTAEGPPPTPPWISVALGSAYFRSGAMVDAEREYRQALKIDSKIGEAHNNIAVVCLLTGRYPEAEAEVKAAEAAGIRVSPQLKEDLKKASAKR